MHPYPDLQDQEIPKRKGFWLIAWPIIAFIFAIGCVLLFSCSAEKRITRIAAKHPGSIVKPCNIFLPPLIQSDSVHIVYRSGIPIVTRDTEVVHDVATNVVYKTIHTTSTVHDTVLAEHTITKIDQVRLAAEMQKTEQAIKERDGARIDNARIQNGRNSWRLIALIAIAYMVVRIILRLYLKINLP